MTILNKKISKHSDDAQLYLLRGRVKYERKDFDAAMVDLNSFCVLNKTCGEAEYLKGLILYRQRNYRAAMEKFSRYSTLHEEEKAYLMLGMCHLALNNYEPALGSFERALEINNNSYEAVYNAGLSAYKAGSFESAEKHFLRATEIQPQDRDAWNGLGLSRNALEQFETSSQAFRQTLGIANNNAVALFNIGVNYYELGDKTNACTYWERAKAAGSLAADATLERHCTEKPSKGPKK